MRFLRRDDVIGHVADQHVSHLGPVISHDIAQTGNYATPQRPRIAPRAPPQAFTAKCATDGLIGGDLAPPAADPGILVLRRPQHHDGNPDDLVDAAEAALMLRYSGRDVIHANRRLGYFPEPDDYGTTARGRRAPLWRRSTVWTAADRRPGVGGGHLSGTAGAPAKPYPYAGDERLDQVLAEFRSGAHPSAASLAGNGVSAVLAAPPGKPRTKDLRPWVLYLLSEGGSSAANYAATARPSGSLCLVETT